jgi:lipopolysaccharide heptosyltransferase II
MTNSSPSKKVLFLSLSGLGNFLMQSPIFAALKKTRPLWHLTAWVAPRGTKILAENDPHLDSVIEMPIQASPRRHLQQIQQLRSHHFDIGLVGSPGQLLKSAAYLRCAGLALRLGHSYPLGSFTRSRLFLTHAIPEDPSLHDIEQNLNLLSLLNLPLPLAPTYHLSLPASAHAKAQPFLAALPHTKLSIGFHPGSASHFTWKRWPLEYWLTIGKNLINKYQAHLLIFGGPEEAATKTQIARALAPHATIITTDLLTTTAIMKACRLLLTNDSGLMHLASAAGVPVLALFGPTNEQHTGPRGNQAHVLRAPHTQAVYHTEHNATLGQQPHESLLQLKPELVFAKLQELLR